MDGPDSVVSNDCIFLVGYRFVNRPRPDLCYICEMDGRPVTHAGRLNMRLPPELKWRLERLAITRDFEVRPLSTVGRKALERGLDIIESERAKLY